MLLILRQRKDICRFVRSWYYQAAVSQGYNRIQRKGSSVFVCVHHMVCLFSLFLPFSSTLSLTLVKHHHTLEVLIRLHLHFPAGYKT